jgi:ATP-dependent Lon protease
MSNEIVLHQGQLPTARMRSVYRVDEVGRKLDMLPEKEHEHLRSTYQRMIEKGPDRFQVKPSSLPAMDTLYDDLPNFTEVLDDIKRQVALCQDSSDGLEITPLLLLGPPGIGKTHCARLIAEMLGTGMGFISMSSLTAGWVLSGASSQWKGAKVGKVFETLVYGIYANPVMVIDEIDKAGGEHAYDPLGALYSLLEHDTASTFTDEFAEVAIDASQVIWVVTANDERTIPDPILNRVNIYEIRAPRKPEARIIARKLYRSIRANHDWGKRFEEEPHSDVLELLSEHSPREMRRSIMTAFGNARLAGRSAIETKDIPKPDNTKSIIGFVQ